MYQEVPEISARTITLESGLVVPVVDRLDVAMRAGNHDASIEDYECVLNLDPTQLGERILDLGSSSSEIFSREMSDLGIEVISLNPQLIDPYKAVQAREGVAVEYRGPMFGNIVTYSDIPWAGKSVAGLAQELPFGDDSFDAVLAIASAPCYIPNRDHEVTLREIIRVLREGGVAHLAPIIESPTQDFSEKEFLKALERTCGNYDVVEVSDSGFRNGCMYKRVDIYK